ncbi:AIG2-like family domain-containing protein [Ditylenchus destructor]|uniref:gamma-glutamylcyclotransferase n=1 Tax=Ditylenchus destructor TaxID=166010 RepID=A0AAD4QYZ1_9BILA|nr:AIG2-like family domain-containing protein [Ditylenchus destructor]
MSIFRFNFDKTLILLISIFHALSGSSNHQHPVNTTHRQLRRNDDGHFYYFAFGSNLLKERINVNIPSAQFVSIGRLQNYKLVFYGNSSNWHGGLASIERRRGAKVWGCIWKVPNSFARALDRQELLYRRLDVDIKQPLSHHRRKVRCRTYQYKNPEVGKQRPSPHYKHVIVTGAQEHHLPDSYIERLKKIKTNAYRGRVKVRLELLRRFRQRG